MSIGILYESKEWSNIRIRDLIMGSGIQCEMIHMEKTNPDQVRNINHDLYINRVFPSADMRKNFSSIANTIAFSKKLRENKIRIINSYDAFKYDCSKAKASDKLSEYGLPIPETVYVDTEIDFRKITTNLKQPFILKRNCGGRSHDLRIFENQNLKEHLNINFNPGWIIQKYISPEKGFTTRVEIISKKIMTILKRFLGDNKISSYSRGSRYEIYDDCPKGLIDDSIKAMEILKIEMGSLDFIETKNDGYYLLDVNATSNFTSDYIPLLGFDPIEKMTEYIINQYNNNRS